MSKKYAPLKEGTLPEDGELFIIDDSFGVELCMTEDIGGGGGFTIDDEEEGAEMLSNGATLKESDSHTRPVGVYDFRKSKWSLHNTRTVLKNKRFPWTRKIAEKKAQHQSTLAARGEQDDAPPIPLQNTVSAESLSSNKRAFANIIKSFVGSGIMGLPYAFSQGGLVGSIIVLTFIALLSTHCVHLLVACRALLAKATPHTPPQSFADVGRRIFGWPGQAIVLLGFCVAYIIFIGTNVHDLCRGSYLEGKEEVWTWTLAVTPVLIGLALLRSLKRLAPFSAGSNVLMIAAIAVVFWQSVDNFKETKPLKGISLNTFPIFFGMAIYSFEGIGLALPIETSLRTPESFSALWNGATLMITSLYLLFGGFCYAAYGHSVPSIITQALPPTIFAAAVRLSLVVVLVFTFPIMLHPVVHVAEMTRPMLRDNWLLAVVWKRRLLRAGTVCALAVISLTVPSFPLVLSFIGSLPCNLLAFVLPTVFYLKLHWTTVSIFVKVREMLVCAFGVVAVVVCTLVTVQNILAGNSGGLAHP